jgi:hypothetical protein
LSRHRGELTFCGSAHVGFGVAGNTVMACVLCVWPLMAFTSRQIATPRIRTEPSTAPDLRGHRCTGQTYSRGSPPGKSSDAAPMTAAVAVGFASGRGSRAPDGQAVDVPTTLRSK